jgi:LmbE family N-acetylglucosaminyl deacetylase
MKQKIFTKRNIVLLIVAAAVISISISYLFARKYSMLPDSSARLLATIHEPLATDKVLIVTPHFDDETIAAAGYIQRAENNKSTVKILAVTNSNRRGIGADRKTEFLNVIKSLGANENQLKFLDLPDYYLSSRVSSADLTKDLQNEIELFKPTVIIYPDASDQNRDHKYIGESINGILANQTNLYVYSYLVHWKYFPQPIGLHKNFHITPPIKLVDFSHSWQRFDLTPAEEDQKLNALEIYKSQLRTPLLHDLLISMVRENELFSEKLIPTNK